MRSRLPSWSRVYAKRTVIGERRGANIGRFARPGFIFVMPARFARGPRGPYTRRMHFEIVDVQWQQLPEVLALNEQEEPHVGKVDLGQMQWFATNAAYFRVAMSGDRLAAFLIGLRPGSLYQSPNYRWFSDRYKDFAYVDRVAVASAFRRHGLASQLYDDFAASVPASVTLMACEVNVRPANDESMRFHERLGFRQVGTQETENGAKEVALLVKSL